MSDELTGGTKFKGLKPTVARAKKKKTDFRAKVEQPAGEPVEQVWVVFKTADGDFNMYQPGVNVPMPKDATEVFRSSDMHEANREMRKRISRKQAKRAHKKAPAKLVTRDFDFIAAALRTLPVSFGDVMVIHMAEHLALTNPNFDADKFFAAVKGN